MEIESIHLQAKLIQRSKQQNAVASAAYRSGSALTDENSGEVFDYRRRQAIERTRILSPSYAPEWVRDRSTLWNTVEAVEKRKDAQVAREIEISIPAALPSAVREQLIWTFCEQNFVALGMVADVCLHGPGHGDPRNYHAHVMLSTRVIGPDGFGNKNRDWNANEHLETWKTNWERDCNAALEAAGANIRVDRRSIEDRREEKLAAAETAADWIVQRQFEIEAERLNYTPRPHMPQKAYRAMVKGEVHPGYETETEAWKQARISKDAAAARADEMQQILDAEIAALSDLGANLEDAAIPSNADATGSDVETPDAADLAQPDHEDQNVTDPERQTRENLTPEAPDGPKDDSADRGASQGGSGAAEATTGADSASQEAQNALAAPDDSPKDRQVLATADQGRKQTGDADAGRQPGTSRKTARKRTESKSRKAKTEEKPEQSKASSQPQETPSRKPAKPTKAKAPKKPSLFDDMVLFGNKSGDTDSARRDTREATARPSPDEQTLGGTTPPSEPPQSRSEARRAAKEAKAEARSLQAAQRAAERELQAVEKPIRDSRERALRGRALVNTAKGTWNKVRTGRKMFTPSPADQLRTATDNLLAAATWLLKTWNDFRSGKMEKPDFDAEERGYIKASAALAEMHMVMPDIKTLNVPELSQEQDRLQSLQDFPEQALISPVMGAVRSRLKQIIAYMTTSPEGRAKVDAHSAKLVERQNAIRWQEAREAMEEKSRQQRLEQDRRNEILWFVEETLERAQTDPEIWDIIQALDINFDRTIRAIAFDPAWEAPSPGSERAVWEVTRTQVDQLDYDRDLVAKAEAQKNELQALSKPIGRILVRARKDEAVRHMLFTSGIYLHDPDEVLREDPIWLRVERGQQHAVWKEVLKYVEQREAEERFSDAPDPAPDASAPDRPDLSTSPRGNNGFNR